MRPEIRESVGDYLRGYVAGYWAGYDFAVDEPALLEMGKGESGPADGGADAPTTAPAPDLSGASRPALEQRRATESSRASAVSSLPAIHQPAAPSEGVVELELAGELERLHAHRGMVTGLRSMAELLERLGFDGPAQICLGRALAAHLDEDES